MKVYMIGIGGASMSGLCEILLEKGMSVSGSDLNGCARLSRIGVKVFSRHRKENIPEGTQIVVYSSAISEENVEYQRAVEMGVCMFSRGELLGLISRGYKKCVAVSGSHGKTTTTAMIAEIFAFAGKNATVHLGGEHAREKCGNGEDIFLCEACEYRDNFLHLVPTVGVITNMELDHPDFFKTESQMHRSFGAFANNSRIFLAGKNAREILQKPDILTCEVVENGEKFSGETADFSARNLSCESGLYRFDFYKNEAYICEINLKILGKFNVENALFACAVASIFGATPFEIQKGISSFYGVARRLEKLENSSGGKAEIYCDYAHHPTQISKIAEIFTSEECTACKSANTHEKSTLVIFQPHTYSRTVAFFDDFVSALSLFSHLWITTTYPAREKFEYCGCGEFLSASVKNARFVEYDALPAMLKNHAGGYQRVLFLGAGNIDIIAKNYAKDGYKNI